MTALKKLFKNTFIYGLATVLPRVLGLILTPLYVAGLPESDFGIYISLMIYLIMGNVFLSYGMETAFFRFINRGDDPGKVQSTALTSLTITSTLFLTAVLLFRDGVAAFLKYETAFIVYAALILFLDALAVIPFAWYRQKEKPLRYSFIKISNVVLNLALNLFFFLVLPVLTKDGQGALSELVFENKVHYIFISNLIASAFTLLMVLPLYFRIGFKLDTHLWKQMIAYALPVLVAGLAFSINEGGDKLMLRYLLPDEVAEAEVGVYGAAYKLGAFMALFITAFKLGVEPFFFSQANKKDAKQTYANITLYFTIFGSFILLFVVVYTDLFAMILLPEKSYWRALWIVPFILLANLCLGIYHNLSVWYKITDRTRFGALISVGGAVITIGLNFLLIPVLSYKGSAIATLAAYGSMMVISYLLGRRYYPVPYNVKKIGAYLGASIGLSALSFYVFKGDLLSGTALLLLFLTLIWYLERRELLRLFKPLLDNTVRKLK
ncbi:polysaccharide biosynthesis protein [Robertkochia marina]|uniref:Polysaccharide biosynthesis protein n=1 Tax=Robertkochia marina TaxID=1227945 RepID=A0A4S3M2K6_9FLAO|nr:oligosaccharide flippase family protein [Robertkochia marina]THD69362.1 polysaccharide biosynthesis protein [Robertkochia marina]TRZ47377.1 polysaccharide biosynthesis protein [Robertkochia marina]